MVVLFRQKTEMIVALLAWMHQEVAVNFFCQVVLLEIASYVAQRRQQQRTGGQSLLTVNQMEARVLARLGTTWHEHQEAHEVVSSLVGDWMSRELIHSFSIADDPSGSFAGRPESHTGWVSEGSDQRLDGRLHATASLISDSASGARVPEVSRGISASRIWAS